MRRHQLSAFAIVAVAITGACADEPERKPPPSWGGTVGGSDTGGSAAGGAGAEGGDGGSGSAGSTDCGDGVRTGSEECDGEDLGGANCQIFGFDGGELSCGARCELDHRGCFGVENCADAQDNDGDGDADCQDRECASVCADACSAPFPLADGVATLGSIAGHASTTDSHCITEQEGKGGGEVIYELTAAHTGVMDIQLLSSDDLVLGVRTDCGDVNSELACKNDVLGAERPELLTMPVAQGERYFVVVEGFSSSTKMGTFELFAASRLISCGDGHLDGNEECDDGNLETADGCDDNCVVESSELEPNDDADAANPFVEGWIGQINPSDDEDWIRIDVPAGKTSLTVEAIDFDGSCAGETADSYIEIWSIDAQLLASDDDSGEGYCARATASGIAAGVYYIRVYASPFGELLPFPYGLMVTFLP